MQAAVNRFQKNIFILLIYLSGFAGIISDLALESHMTMFYLVFDVVIIFLSLLSLSYLRSGMVSILLFLIACFIFNVSYSEASAMSSLNGIREMLMLMAIVVFYNKVFSLDEESQEEYLAIMKRFALIFLVMQLPVTAVQFALHGPSDFVGGTYGARGTGLLTLTVLCLIFFMHPFMKNFGRQILLFVTMVPLVLNETKISFILIPMTVMFIYFKPKIKNILLGAVAGLFFLFLFSQYYGHTNANESTNMADIFSSDFIDDYLFGDIYYSDDIPRFTKIIVAWQLLAQESVNTFLFGFEYGIFKGGNMVEPSQLAQTYQWLMVGTRPYLFFLLLQGGIMLVAGVFLLIGYINKWFRDNNKFKNFLLIMFIITLTYTDAFRNQAFSLIYFYLVFYANSSLYKRYADK